jgi:hypothetical protein
MSKPLKNQIPKGTPKNRRQTPIHAKLLSKDEGGRIAANIAKLP